jgi:hypothetical protein
VGAGTGVFVLRDENTLVPMQVASFASEDDFQRLLADFPALLAGDQMDRNNPKRFLLISREQGIASEEGGSARWSLDHLFLDQEGIPTLVEVKRGTDSRIRREVVGQMLDYAANCVVYWPVEELRARFETRCAEDAEDPAETFIGFLGPEADVEAFWGQVRTNLQAGKVRMLFVADRIPTELRRVVEFLNGQMQRPKFWRSRFVNMRGKVSRPWSQSSSGRRRRRSRRRVLWLRPQARKSAYGTKAASSKN